jgi:hypothetical protein
LIQSKHPAAWAALLALVAGIAYLVYDELRPDRAELLRTACDGYAGTVVAKGSDSSFYEPARTRVYYVVVREDTGKEARHVVTATEWGTLPVGGRVEKAAGCGESPMQRAGELLREHPEVLKRIK